MTTVSADDTRYMSRAVQLARRGLYTTRPNPRVGCVLVRDGVVLAEGWHERAGEAHAEVMALSRAGEAARGATAYVTLEPCAHQGRTGPCADALIAAGIRRVVVGMTDPNPEVAGGGIARLREAGIGVDTDVLQAQAEALNPGFVRRMAEGRPWVRLKVAVSLDGRTAMASGESRWVTGEPARRDVQRLRARHCAVITGIGTALADDPRLNVRDAAAVGVPLTHFPHPLRVVVDSRGRLPATARILAPPGEALVATTPAGQAALPAGVPACVPAESGDGRADLPDLLRYLARARACNEVLVEAGPALAGAFVQAGLVDELIVYQAPLLLGSAARPMLDLPLQRLAQAFRLRVVERRQLGPDQRLVLRTVTED